MQTSETLPRPAASTDTLRLRRGASTNTDARVAARELFQALDQPGIRFAMFYCSSEYELPILGAELRALFGDTPIIGCTTAGEITPLGYLNGALTGVSIASTDIEVVIRRIDRLHEFEFSVGDAVAHDLMAEFEKRGRPVNGSNAFAFMLIDGLATKEEAVVSAVHPSLGGIQLFGGSAGDGTRFNATHVFHDGEFRQDAAVVALFRTAHPFVVFKTQHFVSSEEKMVVTEADPGRRIVTEINGEPAGREYARAVGLDVEELSPLIFATYPVVVTVGGQPYVRSIQKVNADESLTFFCAIDEGIVLTVARGVDLVDNLQETFAELRNRIGEPELIIGCDCILRNLELDQRGIKDQVGTILARNNVVGFATYGEQFNSMHVNQTLTGVAIGSVVR